LTPNRLLNLTEMLKISFPKPASWQAGRYLI